MVDDRTNRNTQGLLDSLVFYIPGDEKNRRKVAIELMDKLIQERALDLLKKKYGLQGLTALEGIKEGLLRYENPKDKEALVKSLDKKVVKKKAAKKRENEKEVTKEDKGGGAQSRIDLNT